MSKKMIRMIVLTVLGIVIFFVSCNIGKWIMKKHPMNLSNEMFLSLEDTKKEVTSTIKPTSKPEVKSESKPIDSTVETANEVVVSTPTAIATSEDCKCGIHNKECGTNVEGETKFCCKDCIALKSVSVNKSEETIKPVPSPTIVNTERKSYEAIAPTTTPKGTQAPTTEPVEHVVSETSNYDSNKKPVIKFSNSKGKTIIIGIENVDDECEIICNKDYEIMDFSEGTFILKLERYTSYDITIEVVVKRNGKEIARGSRTY